jgi:UDP:flavonoid glycosyltransferase YjiC (YdhE family)
MLPLERLRANRLTPLVKRVLTQESYRQQAMRLQAEIRKIDGVRRAADIVERVLSTGKPVLREGTTPCAAKAATGRPGV